MMSLLQWRHNILDSDQNPISRTNSMASSKSDYSVTTSNHDIIIVTSQNSLGFGLGRLTKMPCIEQCRPHDHVG